MSTSCQHEQCEPYDSCQAPTEEEGRDDFWFRFHNGLGTAHLGSDPLAWLNGDTSDE